jgi:hypothetical protein
MRVTFATRGSRPQEVSFDLVGLSEVVDELSVQGCDVASTGVSDAHRLKALEDESPRPKNR